MFKKGSRGYKLCEELKPSQFPDAEPVGLRLYYLVPDMAEDDGGNPHPALAKIGLFKKEFDLNEYESLGEE